MNPVVPVIPGLNITPAEPSESQTKSDEFASAMLAASLALVRQPVTSANVPLGRPGGAGSVEAEATPNDTSPEQAASESGRTVKAAPERGTAPDGLLANAPELAPETVRDTALPPMANETARHDVQPDGAEPLGRETPANAREAVRDLPRMGRLEQDVNPLVPLARRDRGADVDLPDPVQPISTTRAGEALASRETLASLRRADVPGAPQPPVLQEGVRVRVENQSHARPINRSSDREPIATVPHRTDKVLPAIGDDRVSVARDLQAEAVSERIPPAPARDRDASLAGVDPAPRQQEKPEAPSPQPGAQSLPPVMSGATDASPAAEPIPRDVRATQGTVQVDGAGESKPRADHVTVTFTDDNGEEGRLRVALRGSELRATLVTGDGATAERLSTELVEIRRTLLERGFQEAHVAVQGARRAAEADSATATRGWDDRSTWNEHQRESSREQQQHREPGRRHREAREAFDGGDSQEGRDQ